MAELTMADRALTAKVTVRANYPMVEGGADLLRDDVLRDMRESTVFRADEVAAYVFNSTRPGDWNPGESFPGLRLPFSPLLVEYNRVFSKGSYHVGVLFTDGPATPETIEQNAAFLGEFEGRASRVVSATVLIERNQDVDVHVPAFFFATDSSGSVLTYWAYGIPGNDSEDVRNALAGIFQSAVPGLLAVSLANCRNTQLVEHRPNPKLAARREKRQGCPVHSFRTLRIESLRKARPCEVREPSSDGAARAQHHVRGHFKSYQTGRGLFGRLKGTFWFGPSMRGSAEAGLVEKDYAVAPSPAAPGVRGA